VKDLAEKFRDAMVGRSAIFTESFIKTGPKPDRRGIKVRQVAPCSAKVRDREEPRKREESLAPV